MKSFLEEYGFAILAAVVVILLIMMISPVGITVRDSLRGVVLKFSNSAESGLDGANNKLENSLLALGSSDGSGQVNNSDNQTCSSTVPFGAGDTIHAVGDYYSYYYVMDVHRKKSVYGDYFVTLRVLYSYNEASNTYSGMMNEPQTYKNE